MAASPPREPHRIGEPSTSKTALREKGLRCGAVSADGRWLAQGTNQGEVVVWKADPETSRLSLRQALPLKPSRVALSCVGPHLAVSQWNGTILVLDVKTSRQVKQYKLKRTLTPLALSNDHMAAGIHSQRGYLPSPAMK